MNQSDKDLQKQTIVPGSKSIFKNRDKVDNIHPGRVTKPFLRLCDSRKEYLHNRTKVKIMQQKRTKKLTSALKNKPKTQQNKICHSDDVLWTDKTKGDLSEGCIRPSLVPFS